MKGMFSNLMNAAGNKDNETKGPAISSMSALGSGSNIELVQLTKKKEN